MSQAGDDDNAAAVVRRWLGQRGLSSSWDHPPTGRSLRDDGEEEEEDPFMKPRAALLGFGWLA